MSILKIYNGTQWVTVSTAGESGFSGYSGVGQSGYSGISGTNGTVGTSGYSGVSGANGTVGTSGYSGVSGTSGYSGVSGYSGTSGKSGYSGISGYSGVSGATGTSGYSGVSGAVGTSGYSGISGTNGTVGTSGYSGISGASTSGYSGISGASTSGYSGVSGTSGYSGISGYSGVGTSGYSGVSGNSGYSGVSLAIKDRLVFHARVGNETAGATANTLQHFSNGANRVLGITDFTGITEARLIINVDSGSNKGLTTWFIGYAPNSESYQTTASFVPLDTASINFLDTNLKVSPYGANDSAGTPGFFSSSWVPVTQITTGPVLLSILQRSTATSVIQYHLLEVQLR